MLSAAQTCNPVLRSHRRAIPIAGTILLLLWALMLVGSAARAEQTLVCDPQTSSVTFALTDTLHAVQGTFQIASGRVSFDAQTGAMSGQIVVNSDSGHSDSPTRDHRMIEDELKATLFPAVTFAPTHFSGTLAPSGRSQLQVTGTLTLLGIAHIVTVPMTVAITGDQATATGRFPIPYVAWGLKDPSVLFLRVGKIVTLGVTLTGALLR